MKTGLDTAPYVVGPPKIEIDPHFPTSFFAALFGVSESCIVKWFRDVPGVLKLQRESKNGKRVRAELRIPWSVAMREHDLRSR